MIEKINLPIDTDHEDTVHPLRPDWSWLAKMLLFVAVVLGVVVGFSYIFSSLVIAKIDILTEKRYFADTMLQWDEKLFDRSTLTTLSGSDAFDGYDIYVSQSPEINAYATLGANIIITRALLESVETEEELLFILAHERTHIEHRHILQSLSRSLPIVLTIQFLGIDLGDSKIDISKLAQNSLMRWAEKDADRWAIEFLKKYNINTDCATRFFEKEASSFEKYVVILSDHPTNQSRIEAIRGANTHPDKPCTPYSYKKSSN